MRKLRTLLLEVGLILLAILFGKIFDTPLGYCIAGVLAVAFIFVWFIGREEDKDELGSRGVLFDGDIPAPEKPKVPSIVFIFGAPLGDNNSSTWIMMLRHYGPGPAHNCACVFYDDDRINIGHQWLVNHPGTPFLPPSQLRELGERSTSLHVAEAGPEGSLQLGSFNWSPLDPDRQHYTVSISCRDGVFAEKWDVTRVDGALRAKLVIEHGPEWIRNNPDKDPVVFRCEDRGFISTPLLTAVPAVTSSRHVHPGWKPNYRIEIPMAIIDSNGNIQVASGLQQPDGTTHANFGCWDILTKHFGDAPSRPQ
jgi:hypothetical protein